MVGLLIFVGLFFYSVAYSGVRKLQGVDISIIGALTGAEEVATPTDGATPTTSTDPAKPDRNPAAKPSKGIGSTAGGHGGGGPRRSPPGTGKHTGGGGGGGGSDKGGCARPPKLQTWKGITMTPQALRALKKADDEARRSGGRIVVGSSFRTCAAQESACNGICGAGCKGCPGKCAPCGQSKHQRGEAIDVINYGKKNVFHALTSNGFCHPLPDSDPVHFSYAGCG